MLPSRSPAMNRYWHGWRGSRSGFRGWSLDQRFDRAAEHNPLRRRKGSPQQSRISLGHVGAPYPASVGRHRLSSSVCRLVMGSSLPSMMTWSAALLTFRGRHSRSPRQRNPGVILGFPPNISGRLVMAARATSGRPLATALPATWRSLRALWVSSLVNSRVIPASWSSVCYRVAPQSIKAPGRLSSVDHHRRPRCDHLLDDPAFLPATDDRVQVMPLAESQCLKYVAGTIGSEDKDPVLSSVFKRCSARRLIRGCSLWVSQRPFACLVSAEKASE